MLATDQVHHYHVFGGCLASTLEFPELDAAAPGPADWTLRVAERLPRCERPALAGEELLPGGVAVRLVRHAHGARLTYDDTGAFDLSADGRAVAWERTPGVSAEAVRTDVISRVLATALHLRGTACLHGSGVVAGGRAIVFLAPKLHGKSTLATALVRAGARLLSDDAVAVTPGEPPLARPGVHSVRLWRDSAARLANVSAAAPDEAPDGKQLLRHFAPAQIAREAAPLGAVYLLAPAPRDARDAVVRVRLGAMPAAVGILRQAKLGALLGGGEAGVVLDQAAAIARSVPVYTLHVARDFDRVDDVAARLLEWHADASAEARAS